MGATGSFMTAWTALKSLEVACTGASGFDVALLRFLDLGVVVVFPCSSSLPSSPCVLARSLPFAFLDDFTLETSGPRSPGNITELVDGALTLAADVTVVVYRSMTA